MKLLFALGFLALAGSAQAEEMQPIRMASVHGTIHRQIVNRADGYEDVVSTPLCQFTSTIPVYDLRKDEDYSRDAILATCESTVQGTPVAVRLIGKLALEIWGEKEVKGANFTLRSFAPPGKEVLLPRVLNGYVGSRDLGAHNLMIYLDPTGWNGDQRAPMEEETFAATVEVEDQ